MIKFLIDADLPNSLITFLKSHGYDTLFAIIVFRTHLMPYEEMYSLLLDLLQKTLKSDLLGSLIIIQKMRVRIRKP